MRRVNVLVSQLLLLAGLMVGVNGQAFGETDTEMIVGGTAAPDGKYPWQVRLYSNMDDTIGFCGGSIIAPQWVLTAGHCLIDSDAVVVGYGSNDRTKTKKIESEKIIVHPGYIAGEKADLALVKLKQPIPDAAAISFADAAKEQALMPAGRHRHRHRLGRDLGLPGIPECRRRHGRAQVRVGKEAADQRGVGGAAQAA